MTKKTHYFILISAFTSLLLLVLYLFQVENLIKSNYLSQKYQEEIKALSEENLALEQTFSKVLSLENIEKEVSSLGFVETSKVTYIPISSDYLVRETH